MTRMDTFTACSIVEGFDGCEHTDAEQQEEAARTFTRLCDAHAEIRELKGEPS